MSTVSLVSLILSQHLKKQSKHCLKTIQALNIVRFDHYTSFQLGWCFFRKEKKKQSPTTPDNHHLLSSASIEPVRYPWRWPEKQIRCWGFVTLPLGTSLWEVPGSSWKRSRIPSQPKALTFESMFFLFPVWWDILVAWRVAIPFPNLFLVMFFSTSWFCK